MGEAKQRKALDDIYGRGKLPVSARSFIRAMQEAVEFQAVQVATESSTRTAHQFFLEGELDGKLGVYGLSIPAKLFNFGEYAFTASIHALTGFMGATRFGIAMHASDQQSVSAVKNDVRGRVTTMLACVDGAWFYNMMNAGEKGTITTFKMGEWNQAKIADLAMSNQTNQFMSAIEGILKKSQALQDNTKARMTLQFLKEHYHATITAPMERQSGLDASIN